MSAATTILWKQRNRERELESKRQHIRRRRAYGNPMCHIEAAFAQRFGVTQKVVETTGSRVLCQCKSDEARRILLGCSE